MEKILPTEQDEPKQIAPEELGLSVVLDRVVLQPIEHERVSAGGILIPDTAEADQAPMGRIIAVGPGIVTTHGQLIKPRVNPGDIVIYRVERVSDPFNWGGVLLLSFHWSALPSAIIAICSDRSDRYTLRRRSGGEMIWRPYF